MQCWQADNSDNCLSAYIMYKLNLVGTMVNELEKIKRELALWISVNIFEPLYAGLSE